jgi:Na+/proline symporter
MVIRDHLPSGWRGILLAAFFAAYMSTIATQLNWGTSYIVNDFYRRFVRPDAVEQHYVGVSRVTTILLMIASAIVTFYLESIRQAWEFVLESGAGIGLVLILRWYWWRINAWSEIAAMVGAAAGYAAIKMFTPLVFPVSLIVVVAWTTVCWLAATLATAPEPDDRLVEFYRRTRPDGPGWTRVAALAGGPPPQKLAPLVGNWIAGTILVYSVLFGVGTALLRSVIASVPFFLAAALAAFAIQRSLARRGWETVVR